MTHWTPEEAERFSQRAAYDRPSVVLADAESASASRWRAPTLRSILRAALGAAAVLGVSASVQQTHAACPAPGPAINSLSARLVSNPDWCLVEASGCYAVAPPVSSGLDGFFWGQTGANGARNAGVDSGAFLIASWTYSPPPVVGESGDLYYYHVVLADPDNGAPFSWDGSGIDGCISDITPTTSLDECTCMVLTDSLDGQGYAALLSAKVDRFGHFNLFDEVLTWVVFAPIPRPVVTNTMRDPANGDLTFTVAVPTVLGGAGDYRSPLCDCGIGFRIYEQMVVNGEIPSNDRRACTQETLFRSTGQSIAPDDPSFRDACAAAGFAWVPALHASGATQSFTPFGAQTATTAVKVPCGDPERIYDVYLAVSLGTNEGPGQIQFTHVGPNSFLVQCSGSTTLAEPGRPRNPEAPRRSAAGSGSRGGLTRER